MQQQKQSFLCCFQNSTMNETNLIRQKEWKKAAFPPVIMSSLCAGLVTLTPGM